jgi:hypothetical protein
LPLSGLAGNNPASCREKNTPTPELLNPEIFAFCGKKISNQASAM